MYQIIKESQIFPNHVLEYRKDRYFYYVLLDGKRIASFHITINTRVGSLSVKLQDVDDLYELLNRIYQFLINRYRLEKVTYSDSNKEIREELKKLSFYAKGKILQKVTDPYRLLCKKGTFDEEGFIVRQDNTDVIPFGLFNSKDKGCGWIAAYNLLHLNQINLDIYDVSSCLSQSDFFFSAFGESVFLLYKMLKEKLPVKFLSHTEKYICNRIRSSDCGILLYYYKHGAHFTMYRKIDLDKYQFINAVYGRKIVLTPEEFMKKYTILYIGTIIYM